MVSCWCFCDDYRTIMCTLCSSPQTWLYSIVCVYTYSCDGSYYCYYDVCNVCMYTGPIHCLPLHTVVNYMFIMQLTRWWIYLILGLETLSCLHTTIASLKVTCSLHIVPQTIVMKFFNSPFIWDIPFPSLMSPWVQFPALATSLSWHTTLVARLEVTDAPVTTGQDDREGSAPLHAKPEMAVGSTS